MAVVNQTAILLSRLVLYILAFNVSIFHSRELVNYGYSEMFKFIFCFLSCWFFYVEPACSEGNNIYSVNTGSFVYHLTGNHGQYNENFNNKFFSVERKFSTDSQYSMIVGTMKNSFDDRCMAIGLRKDWMASQTGWTFKGVYGYTGEFFFKAFQHCGDSGTYATAKKLTGVGFSPYIYHAAQYNFTRYYSIESGVILPSIFVVSMQWSF